MTVCCWRMKADTCHLPTQVVIDKHVRQMMLDIKYCVGKSPLCSFAPLGYCNATKVMQELSPRC
jgi:hypothetical protein